MDPLYFHNATVKLAHTQKHLHLQLDSKFSFNEHTNNKVSKAIKFVGILRQLRPILQRRNLLIIYKFFTRPHLDYGDVIYDQLSNVSFSSKIGSVQHNSSLAITGANSSFRDNLYRKLGLQCLQQRGWMRWLCLLYNFFQSGNHHIFITYFHKLEILTDTPTLS